MIIYTSSFDNIKYIEYECPSMTFISISMNTPKWFLKKYKYEYKTLAPTYNWYVAWMSMFKSELMSKKSITYFNNQYNKNILDGRNIEKCINSLNTISKNNKYICLVTDNENEVLYHNLLNLWFSKNGYYSTDYKINCFVKLIVDNNDRLNKLKNI